MMLSYKDSEKIAWTIRVPILRNAVILKQLAIAIGIPFGLLLIFLLIIKAYYGVGLIALLFLLTYLFINIVWGGKYDVGFELDKTGIRSFTLENQAKKNSILNAITVVAGLLSGKPAVAGAGFLAQSRQDIMMRWRNIKKVSCYPQKHTVIIRGGLTESIAVFCTKDNYHDVDAYIRSRLRGQPIRIL
ncbi:MAG: hypothetical protein GZ094_04145 [Mariniphaga sp.]|nr:hypothetical protein [Mariniphaga sp.]